MKLCLSCLQSKELESTFVCKDCQSKELTGKELTEALRTMGSRYVIVKPQQEVVKQ